jgi:hypothetical protein
MTHAHGVSLNAPIDAFDIPTLSGGWLTAPDLG